MLGRTAVASSSVSVPAVSPTVPKFLGLKRLPYNSFSTPNIKWNYTFKFIRKSSIGSRMETRASALPLKNADELIDSVETFIFDCDGQNPCFFLILIIFCFMGH